MAIAPPPSSVRAVSAVGRGHRELLLRWDEERTPHEDVRRLAEALEAAVARGARFLPGDTVQVGWTNLRVVESGARLALVEPDFTRTPLQYAHGIDIALAHLRAQDELLDRLDITGDARRPRLDARVDACAHPSAPLLALDRREPSPGASGWTASCHEEEELTPITVYELVCRAPHLVPFLALPPGSTVACTEDDAVIWHTRGSVLVRTELTTRVRASARIARLARCGSIR